MATRKTTSKAIYIFVSASILLILVLAYLFRPPLDKRPRRPGANVPQRAASASPN